MPSVLRTKHRLLTCRPRYTLFSVPAPTPTSIFGRGLEQTMCHNPHPAVACNFTPQARHEFDIASSVTYGCNVILPQQLISSPQSSSWLVLSSCSIPQRPVQRFGAA